MFILLRPYKKGIVQIVTHVVYIQLAELIPQRNIIGKGSGWRIIGAIIHIEHYGYPCIGNQTVGNVAVGIEYRYVVPRQQFGNLLVHLLP